MHTHIAIAATAALLLAATASTAAPAPKGPASPRTTPLRIPPDRCEAPDGTYRPCLRAVCRDHTTWSGTNRAEACMHHNGVERWV